MSISKKTGLDDWLASGGTAEQARELIERDSVEVLPLPVVNVNYGRVNHVAEVIGKRAAETGVLFRLVSDINSNAGAVIYNPGETNGVRYFAPAEGGSLFETFVAPYKETPKGRIESVFPESSVRQIISTPAFIQRLDPVVSITQCPVLVMVEGQLRTIVGYDRETGIYAAGEVIEPNTLEEATSRILSVDGETAFASGGDRSRAVAHSLAPAFTQGRLLSTPSPILGVEGNDSQAGKGKKEKRTAAIYNAVPVIVNQTGGSTGSIEEGLDAALIDGAGFISMDNLEDRGRGPFACPKLCSMLTESTYTARAAYTKNIQVDPGLRIFMLTSNGATLLKDILNRLCMVRLVKQHGRKFKRYPEGSQEAHIRANYPVYLGAVFRIIREWYARGCPRTAISLSTGFDQWWQVMDWIVINLFKLPSVIEGYQAVSDRVTDQELSWFRNVVRAVADAGKLDHKLQVTELLEIMLEVGVNLPGCNGVYSTAMLTEDKLKNLRLGIGVRISRIFHKRGDRDSIIIDCWKITREEEQRTYPLGGVQTIKLYTITQMPVVSGGSV